MRDQLNIRFSYRVSRISPYELYTDNSQDCWQLPYRYLHANATDVPCRSADDSPHVVDEEMGGFYKHNKVTGSDKGIRLLHLLRTIVLVLLRHVDQPIPMEMGVLRTVWGWEELTSQRRGA